MPKSTICGSTADRATVATDASRLTNIFARVSTACSPPPQTEPLVTDNACMTQLPNGADAGKKPAQRSHVANDHNGNDDI